MDTDKICVRCGQRLSSGARKRLIYRTGMVFFVGMAILMTAVVPNIYPGSTKFNEIVARSMAYGVMCMISGMVGFFVGWVLGLFIED
jgi:hypothetical protein